MKWVIEVRKLEGDAEMVRALVEAVGLRFVDDKFPEPRATAYVTDDAFDNLPTNADVWRQCKKREAAIADLPNDLFPDGRAIVELGSLVELRGDTWVRHIFGSADIVLAPFTVSATGTVSHGNLTADEIEALIKEQERREHEARIERAARYARAYTREPRVAAVLDLLKEPPSSHSLWHIYEHIEAQLGGSAKELVAESQARRFRGSMNHPDVLGKGSRHAVQTKPAPTNPMSLDEATTFIRGLVDAWVVKIAEQPD